MGKLDAVIGDFNLINDGTLATAVRGDENRRHKLAVFRRVRRTGAKTWQSWEIIQPLAGNPTSALLKEILAVRHAENRTMKPPLVQSGRPKACFIPSLVPHLNCDDKRNAARPIFVHHQRRR
jgi:hypothetical protein